MGILLAAVATPFVVWAADKWFCNGEFAVLVLEAIGEGRTRRIKQARRRSARAGVR